MGTPIRVLFVEDSEDDALLLISELREAGYDPAFERVDSAEAMKAALATQPWDLVISDYSMRRFSASAALTLLQESGLDLPFIIVSGAIGEDAAVSAMKAGAHDWVMKSNPARLHPAIERELREASGRRDCRRADAALRESEERYALAAHGANDGLWDWNLKRNEIYFSPRWKAMLGFEDNEIESSPDEWFNRVHDDDLGRVKMEVEAHLGGLTRRFENEHRMVHKDGTYRWMLSRGIAVPDADGKRQRMAGSFTDVTDRKQSEEQLLHDAFHDALTGLPNRALFMDRLGQAIARAKRRKGYLFAVLFLDLDRFKVVNDSLGHVIGDELLIAIAQRLEASIRPGDTVARLGGDEFVILLDDIRDLGGPTRVANRVQKELALPFSLNGREVFTTASIGIALSSTGYERPEDLLQDSDTAMYRAKMLGRARHEVFVPGMRAGAVALLQLETDMRQAVEREEFSLHYQPIVSLGTGRIIGFEALVRWAHPQRGLISPKEFIAVAEDTGLIILIGWWTLGEACRQARAWQERFREDPPLFVSVNLSGKQFVQPDLIKEIERILQETGLDARSLVLEITESVIMEKAASTTSRLLQLRALNVQLHIDDFGTGYSSLSYLSRFRFDKLKIDRSFVSRMGLDEENTEIVRTILTLAGNLGIGVIAEGVEGPDQLAQLRALNCGYGQGYFFSKPLDSAATEALIAADPRW